MGDLTVHGFCAAQGMTSHDADIALAVVAFEEGGEARVDAMVVEGAC